MNEKRAECNYISILPSESIKMNVLLDLPVAAIEYSLIYMLGGGGLIGAAAIFLIARMMRR